MANTAPTAENYNETVLIPILQKRVSDLTTQTIVLEARLEIVSKEKAKLEEQVASQQVPQSVSGEVL
jgi:hypothetical protein